MEQTMKLRLLECIGKVFDQSKDCKLEPVFFEMVESELEQLTNYFKVSKHQALIIALVFSLNYKEHSVDFKDLIGHFNCNPMKMLEFSSDFEALLSKGILKKQRNPRRMQTNLYNEQYSVNDKITKAILNNQPVPDLEKEGFKDVIDLLEEFYKLVEQRNREEISTVELFCHAHNLLHANLHFPLMKKIDDLQLRTEDAYFYIYLIWKTLTGNESTDIDHATEDIFDNPSKKVKYIQMILANENILISKKLVEIVEANFFNDTKLKLSEDSAKMLEELGLKLFANKKKRDNIIESDKITPKVLYFNDAENRQLDLLKNLLQENKFRETQSSLRSKGLPTGINVLLHGLPGTGKTETVLQLARETQREIVKVDISQSKSMWFGESEKIIKRIFTDYKAYAKECERMPILLFNESDALISKRKENGTTNVSQTENAIQNIILEELENFDGIFFATTNLAKNLDLAFERRFLFKIEFHKPEISVKAQIWNSKLPHLTLSECETLASNFDFSGGQIDNIVRKNEIHEIIHGVRVDFNNIMEYCLTESLFKNKGAKIGY